MSHPIQPVLLHCGRTLRGWSRTPAVVANGFIMPIAMLLIVLLIFGRSIEAISPVEPIARLVPLMISAGVMFAAIASSVSLVVERGAGLHDRFATLPNPPLAPLLGRVCAEALRGVATGALVLLVGTALGFRAGPFGYLGILALALAFSFALGTFTTWLGSTIATPEGVMALTPLLMILMFFNTGFVPLDSFPDSLQPLVRVNPLSAVTEAMTALGAGDATAGQLVGALGWCVGLVALGVALLARARARA